MALNSKAVFEAKISKLGMSVNLNDFKRLGWDTLAKFAFAANYVPGKADDTPFVNDVVIPLFHTPNPPEKAALRQLFYVAYSMNAAEMVRMTTANEDEDKPKKLPAAERNARFVALAEKLLPGIVLEGELEPSVALVEKLVHMRDSGVIQYLKWEELTKREQELRGVKKDEFWKENQEGALMRIFKNIELKAEMKDLLRLQYALQRRGASLEMGRLMSFEKHELIVKFLFKRLTADPMEDHYPVSLNQVKEADLQIFLKLGELTRAGFEACSDEEMPLDSLVQSILADSEIAQIMFQKQKPAGRAEGAESGIKRDNDGELDRLRRENKRLKDNQGAKGRGKAQGYQQGDYDAGKGKGGNKGGSKGKPKGQGRGGGGANVGGSMPKELIGMSRASRHGKSLCFDYNMRKGCPVRGDRCSLGEHLCCYPGCDKTHSLQDCDQFKRSGNRRH